MAVRGTVDSGAGGTLVTSVTGTANQVTASPTTGAVVVGLAAISQIATSLAIGGATIGTNALAVTGTATISGQVIVGNGTKTVPSIGYVGATGNGWYWRAGVGIALAGNSGKEIIQFGSSGGIATGGNSVGVIAGGGGDVSTTGTNTIWTSSAAASWQSGSTDVDTAPVAQTLRSQGAAAGGTSNVAGANWTFIASPGKGTGVGGSWILQTAPAGSTGTAVNAAVTRFTVDGPGNVVHGSAALATSVTDGFIYIATCAGTPSGTPTTYTGCVPLIYDTTAHQFWIYDGGWKQPKTPAGAAIVTWQ